MCLLKGKPVLCEKAFTANAREAEELIRIAQEKQVFLAEAIWTRYMPFSRTIRELTESGIIGKPMMLTASLGYPIAHKERIVRLELCGGALYDLGVYPINFALMTFGNDLEKITSTCMKNEAGVDMQNSITFTYRDGRMAVMQTTAFCASDRQGIDYRLLCFRPPGNHLRRQRLPCHRQHQQSATGRSLLHRPSGDRPLYLSASDYRIRISGAGSCRSHPPGSH